MSSCFCSSCFSPLINGNIGRKGYVSFTFLSERFVISRFTDRATVLPSDGNIVQIKSFSKVISLSCFSKIIQFYFYIYNLAIYSIWTNKIICHENELEIFRNYLSSLVASSWFLASLRWVLSHTKTEKKYCSAWWIINISWQRFQSVLLQEETLQP